MGMSVPLRNCDHQALSRVIQIREALMGQEYFVPVALVPEVEPEFLALQGAA